ncbi:MAG: ThuA domain-containing protein [Christensenellaceae bacterium]|jgi:trehalose utilization protein|nr:ThuA domain-containing protein [Christensenellaceae bacterium]
MNITVWNECHPSTKSGKTAKIYPDGIHVAIKDIFAGDEILKVRTVLQEEPENGLTDTVLSETDVLIWWGHVWQNNVLDSVSDKVCKRILGGMGAIFLHSAYASKPFTRLMGTSCTLKWRDIEEKERVWTVNPSHAIVSGIPETFSLEPEIMYGEFFDIPTPDELILLGWYPGGELIRAGCTFRRGYGKVFYFQPGHESCPTFYNENVKRLIYNATLWAAPQGTIKNQIQPIQSGKPAEPVEIQKKKGIFKKYF